MNTGTLVIDPRFTHVIIETTATKEQFNAPFIGWIEGNNFREYLPMMLDLSKGIVMTVNSYLTRNPGTGC